MRSSTSARLNGSLVALGADSIAAINPPSRKQKAPGALARGHVAPTSVQSLHCPPVERTEIAEIEAYRDVFRAAPAGIAAEHGLELLECGELVALKLAALPGVAEVNRAMGVSQAAELDELAGFYGDVGHVVALPPGSGLEEALLAHGYAPGYAWMKFRRGVENPPASPTPLRVEEVGAEGGADFARVVVPASRMPDFMEPWLALLPGRPGWHCFVTYDGREPAGAGALFVSGSTGWLGMGATLESFRGRGSQGALLAERIRRADELGVELLTTETGELVPDRPAGSYRNIVRAGFEPHYLRANYVSPG
jgi:GNAT superfamily N-acetyltransferase